MRQAVVIQHVAFEDLGTLEPALHGAHYAVQKLQAGVDDLAKIDPVACDLLVVLGGPIGVYEQETYPWLHAEIALVKARLAARRPTLGICLGAQLMAAALGARVFPGGNGKEIGWSALAAGTSSAAAMLAPLFAPGVQVLHWHGDTFDLPVGVEHLASTAQYPNQAFAVGDFALALQFHPEVTATDLERWYIGHAAELSQARIAVTHLRQQGQAFAAKLESAAHELWTRWLRSVGH